MRWVTFFSFVLWLGLFKPAEAGLSELIQQAQEQGWADSDRELVDELSRIKASLPQRVKAWQQHVSRGELPEDSELIEWVHQLCVHQLMDDLVVAGGRGRQFLRALLRKYAEQGLSLEALKQIVERGDESLPRQIDVPWTQAHIDLANLRLQNFLDSRVGIDLSKLVLFVKQDGSAEHAHTHPWPGKDAETHAKVVKIRNLVIPPLTFAAAFLGGLVDYLGLSQEDPEAMREALLSLMNVAPWVGGGIGLGFVAQRTIRPSENSLFQKFPLAFITELRGSAVTAVLTLFGVAVHYGPQSISYMAPALAVGAVGAFLEWQFSRYSDWWSTWVWEVGWVERSLEKLTGAKVALRDSSNNFYRRLGRPALGFANNFGVNTLYPAILESAKVGALFLFVDSVANSGWALGWSTLQNALYFTASYGIFQVILGNLRARGDLAETPRFQAETAAVFLNGAIARVLAITMAVSTLGDQIMTSFAAIVSVPALIYFLGLHKIESIESVYTQKLLARGGKTPLLWWPARAFSWPAQSMLSGAKALGDLCGRIKRVVRKAR